MSTLETNLIQPATGTSLTLGASGDTITIPSGATLTNSGTATGFGKILQVVSATDSTQRTTTSTSYVTGSNTLSVSITPSSTSNKIMIIGHTSIHNTTANKSVYLTVYRASSNITVANGFVNYYTTSGYDYNSNAFTFLDSPSSTSSLTYQVYFKVDSGSTGAINSNTTTGSITLMEVAG